MSWQVAVKTVPLAVRVQLYVHVMAAAVLTEPRVVQVQLYLHVMKGSYVDSIASCSGAVILTCHGR